MLRFLHTSLLLLTGTSLLTLAAVGCGSDSSDSDGGASGTGAAASTGGTTGTGATTGVGGLTGTGSATGSGGTSGTGSTTGSGSATGSGSTSGTGGDTGTGGAATGGTGGAATGGTGGVAGTGSTSGTGSTTGSGGGAPTDEPFSFFVTSWAALVAVSGKTDGFGGDLRFGETGPGAGLRGADKICTAIAERSMPGNNKTWRAFLSANDGGDGSPVHAIDRIGEGPWYDRLGRLVANETSELQNARPSNADPEIKNDLPNEDGVPNHNPDGTQVDNHDTLTGSNQDGELESMGRTCEDWTSAVGAPNTAPQIGHSWPRGTNNGMEWIADHRSGGCAPGANLFGQGGAAPGDYRVGAGGGYGGFYCFALTP